MNWLKKLRKNEEGSATIEFLGILPLAFLVLMIIWQFIVGINGVLVAQSAANEYANVYSITKNQSEAHSAAKEILSSTGNYLTTTSINGSEGQKEFQADVSVHINFVFLPDNIFGQDPPSISYTSTAYGRVIE